MIYKGRQNVSSVIFIAQCFENVRWWEGVAVVLSVLLCSSAHLSASNINKHAADFFPSLDFVFCRNMHGAVLIGCKFPGFLAFCE